MVIIAYPLASWARPALIVGLVLEAAAEYVASHVLLAEAPTVWLVMSTRRAPPDAGNA